jgi:hypothetical protein
VPAWLHRHIIGRKGANIKRLTQEYPKVGVVCHLIKYDVFRNRLLMKLCSVGLLVLGSHRVH